MTTDRHRAALIVANSRYDDPSLPPVPDVVKRTKKLTETIGDARIGGFETRMVFDAPARTAAAEIDRFLHARRPRDLVVLYLIGLGVVDWSGRLYFATADTTTGRLPSSAIAASSISAMLDKCEARQQVVIVDCGFGTLTLTTGAPMVGQAGIAAQFASELRPQWQQRVIVTSSDAAQFRLERAADEPSSSAFTDWLVWGLRSGNADVDGDGRVTVDDLFAYVRDALGDRDALQRPQMVSVGPWTRLVVASPQTDPRTDLPRALVDAVSHPLESVRRAAIDDLAALLGTHRRDLRLAAGSALDAMVHDVSRAVAAAAQHARVRDRSVDAVSHARTGPAAGDDRRARPPDDDVQFTVYRPQQMVPDRWYPLLAFAHKSEPIEGDDGAVADPVQLVESQARAVLQEHAGGSASVTTDSRSALYRGSDLLFVPWVEMGDVNPPVASLQWQEPVHRVEFRLRMPTNALGQRVAGHVRIFFASVLIGEVTFRIPVRRTADPSMPPTTRESGRHYRNIFASYSHRDADVVEIVAHVTAVTGDRYLIDAKDLRSGEVWQPRIAELIEQADLFQLFWSTNAMNSPFVRSEWEHALRLRREKFIRPVYWEDPRPADAARQLPPDELNELQFSRLHLPTGRVPLARERWGRTYGREDEDEPHRVVRETYTGANASRGWDYAPPPEDYEPTSRQASRDTGTATAASAQRAVMTNTWAIVSLLLAFIPLVAPLTIITSLIALRQIDQSDGSQRGRTRSIIALALSVLYVFVFLRIIV